MTIKIDMRGNPIKPSLFGDHALYEQLVADAEEAEFLNVLNRSQPSEEDLIFSKVGARVMDDRAEVTPIVLLAAAQGYANLGTEEVQGCFRAAEHYSGKGKHAEANTVFDAIVKSRASTQLEKAVSKANIQGFAFKNEARYDPRSEQPTWASVVDNDPALADERLNLEDISKALNTKTPIGIGTSAYRSLKQTGNSISRWVMGPKDKPDLDFDEPAVAEIDFLKASVMLRNGAGDLDQVVSLYANALNPDTEHTLPQKRMIEAAFNVGTHYHNNDDQKAAGVALYSALKASIDSCLDFDEVASAVNDLDETRGQIYVALAQGDNDGAVSGIREVRNAGKHYEAMTAADVVLTIDPTNVDALYFAGTSAEMSGRNGLALQYAERLTELSPNHSSGKDLLERVS